MIESALGLEIEAGAVIADTVAGRRCVFLAALYGAERDIAARLAVLAAGMPSWGPIDADRAIPWVEGRTAAGELTVDFDGRRVLYGQGELDELALAYATTIHKSQGSEYPAVVIPLATSTTRCCSATSSIPG